MNSPTPRRLPRAERDECNAIRADIVAAFEKHAPTPPTAELLAELRQLKEENDKLRTRNNSTKPN